MKSIKAESKQIYKFGRILTTQTGQPYYDPFPYKVISDQSNILLDLHSLTISENMPQRRIELIRGKIIQ